MRRSHGNGKGRKSNNNSIQTIDLFNQPQPQVDLGYSMSVPAPLQDPSAYALSVSSQAEQSKQANRITVTLGPTFSETEHMRDGHKPFVRVSRFVDPCVALAEKHDIKGFKEQMNIAGIPVLQYREHQKTHPRSSHNFSHNTHKDTLSQTTMQDVSMYSQEVSESAEIMGMSTPVQRKGGDSFIEDSSFRRKRPASNLEGDVSLDTVRSVLRLVDESLLYTPEKTAVGTPKVLRAAPIPSPRNVGPTFAYDNARTNFDPKGGLPELARATPFGVTRI